MNLTCFTPNNPGKGACQPGNSILRATFSVGRKYKCTMTLDCSALVSAASGYFRAEWAPDMPGGSTRPSYAPTGPVGMLFSLWRQALSVVALRLPMDGELTFPPNRRRLPNRRIAETQALAVGNLVLSATIGFDEAGRPGEIFLSGAKDGSGLAAILEDASVVISIALQHGISAAALAKSCARLPTASLAPPYL
jgi:hypothetical protein